MSKPSPYQPTFAEAEEIAANPDLQQLMAWYPDQQGRILAAYRRRQRPFFTTPLKPQGPTHRPKAPSAAGQYQRQIAK